MKLHCASASQSCHLRVSSLRSNAFLFVDCRFVAHWFVDSSDTDALSSFGHHFLLDKVGQLTLFGQHRQEGRDELIIVVRPPTVIDLSRQKPKSSVQ